MQLSDLRSPSAPRLTTETVLISVFSYNRVRELELCLRSLRDMCPGFDVVIVDDASELPGTRDVINRNRAMFAEVFLKEERNQKASRGNLPANIQEMYDYAIAHGYHYLFMVQDDIQFIRPFDSRVCEEYRRLFEGEASTIEVDPRFLRYTGNIVILRDLGAYRYDDSDYRNSYADVGILFLDRMRSLDWTFNKGERETKMAAHKRGLKRVFPFTPIMMHVPYPTIYRKRDKLHRPSLLRLRRGHYSYRYMSPQDIARMDTRPIEKLPYTKEMLKPKGMFLAYIKYLLEDEAKIFS